MSITQLRIGLLCVMGLTLPAGGTHLIEPTSLYEGTPITIRPVFEGRPALNLQDLENFQVTQSKKVITIGQALSDVYALNAWDMTYALYSKQHVHIKGGLQVKKGQLLGYMCFEMIAAEDPIYVGFTRNPALKNAQAVSTWVLGALLPFIETHQNKSFFQKIDRQEIFQGINFREPSKIEEVFKEHKAFAKTQAEGLILPSVKKIKLTKKSKKNLLQSLKKEKTSVRPGDLTALAKDSGNKVFQETIKPRGKRQRLPTL